MIMDILILKQQIGEDVFKREKRKFQFIMKKNGFDLDYYFSGNINQYADHETNSAFFGWLESMQLGTIQDNNLTSKFIEIFTKSTNWDMSYDNNNDTFNYVKTNNAYIAFKLRNTLGEYL